LRLSAGTLHFLRAGGEVICVVRVASVIVLVSLILVPAVVRSQGQAQSATDGARYQVRSGDVLDFEYRQTPELNQSAPVQTDGYISLRMLGDFKVAGLTLDEIRRVVLDAAEKRLKSPEVFVLLKEYERPYFIAGGEVGTPGRFDLRGPTTLMQAIFIAGGLRPNTSKTEVLLFRRIDEEWAEVQSFDLKSMVRAGQEPQDPLLRSGDLLLVPQSQTSKVERFVKWTSIGIFFPLY
jgi:polysaccharide export outer membrane protein